jgi:hypothetical protein
VDTGTSGGGVKITINLGTNAQDARTIDIDTTPQPPLLESADDAFASDAAEHVS